MGGALGGFELGCSRNKGLRQGNNGAPRCGVCTAGGHAGRQRRDGAPEGRVHGARPTLTLSFVHTDPVAPCAPRHARVQGDFQLALWVNTSKNPRMKTVEMPQLNMVRTRELSNNCEGAALHLQPDGRGHHKASCFDCLDAA